MFVCVCVCMYLRFGVAADTVEVGWGRSSTGHKHAVDGALRDDLWPLILRVAADDGERGLLALLAVVACARLHPQLAVRDGRDTGRFAIVVRFVVQTALRAHQHFERSHCVQLHSLVLYFS